MAVVDLSLVKASEILVGHEKRLAVAVSNSPTSTVLSGDPDALDEILAGLERDGVFCRRVKVDYASHSPQMDVLRDELLSTLHGLAHARRRSALFHGNRHRRLRHRSWSRLLGSQPPRAGPVCVRCRQIAQDGIDVFLGSSPHPILLPAIQQCLAYAQREATVLASCEEMRTSGARCSQRWRACAR
jgi:acyl transferase domain-containing protein